MGTPAGHAHHLRVVRLPDDDRLPSLLLRLGYQALDAHHIGAGGVDTPGSPALQLVQNAFQFSVGTDDDGIPRPQRSAVRRFVNTALRQLRHHMGIVDQIAQHPAASLFRGGLFRQLHRPLDAVAKAGALRQKYFSAHRGFPPTAWPPRA